MIDPILSVIAHVALTLIFAFALRQGGRKVRVGRLLIAAGCYLAYWAALFLGGGVQGWFPALAGLEWNWGGKLVGIAITCALLLIVPGVGRREAGWTFRIRRDALIPIVVMTVLMCAFSWTMEAIARDGTNMSLERLLFQATMPGIDEELFLRGLLLALFVQALGEGRDRLGAAFGAPELAVTLLFALGHSVMFVDRWPVFDPASFAITGLLGAALAWIRQRGQSVVPAIVAHNIVNVGNSFF